MNPIETWSVDKSLELYGVRLWGTGYFDISKIGEMQIRSGYGLSGKKVSILEIISGLKERGLEMPVLLRIGDFLNSRIKLLHDSFNKFIKEYNYKGKYRGVYPIKVNQQQQVVEHITDFGKQYHHGLEAGSKAELLVAISYLNDPDACLICNGYKDQEFIDLGLYARKIGLNCIFVIEIPSELELILERAEALKIEPRIGVRIKLTSSAGGQWAASGGDRSVFGLNMTQVVELLDILRTKGKLEYLCLLHYHIGSQIPNIRDIRAGVQEACQVYRGLAEEGAHMSYLDLGGGLAVDYDGSSTNSPSSRNYTLDEYCADIIDTVQQTLADTNIVHPTIITESGRATVAYYSILLFNILDTCKFEPQPFTGKLPKDSAEILKNMGDVYNTMNQKNFQECFNDAVFYKDQLTQLFKQGQVSLRERALGETIFWNIVVEIGKMMTKSKFIPSEMKVIPAILSDIYYGNFSVFQSVPDIWAINHLFPVMPIHRLNEKPTREAIISDITCDCDGVIDRFVDLRNIRETLPLHELKEGEEYYLGVFLVGAYQETLGDLHNLLGDTNVVTIMFNEEGGYDIVRELEGDSVADVLSYVEYDPKVMLNRIRKTAERAVSQQKITPQERRQIMDAYSDGFRGYTYFER